MPKEILNEEASKILPDAVAEVVRLHLGDQSDLETRESWRQTAQKFTPFTEIILRLKAATTKADSYPTFKMQKKDFLHVRDTYAGKLLNAMRFERAHSAFATDGYSQVCNLEANAMARELESEEGLQGKVIESLTLNDVVTAVLSGQLKLARQTQKEVIQ